MKIYTFSAELESAVIELLEDTRFLLPQLSNSDTPAYVKALRHLKATRPSVFQIRSTGDDQALALGWKQTKRNTELSEDKGELPNLRQTGGNDERRTDRVAEQEDDQKRRCRLAQDNDRNHR